MAPFIPAQPMTRQPRSASNAGAGVVPVQGRLARALLPLPAGAGPSCPTWKAPYAPHAPHLAAGAGDTVTVIWPGAAVDAHHGPATSYNLRHSPTGADTWTILSNVRSPLVLSGLPAGTEVRVQVQAVNASGTSPWSPPGTLAVAPATP